MPDAAAPDALAPPAVPADDELVDTVLAASRALVAVAARSLAAAGNEVTLPQYRALVVLAAAGPQGMAELAAALAVNPSTATRLCDRLVRKGLVRRHRQAGDRRLVRIALTAAGRDLVAEVTRRRRAELARLLGALPPGQHEPVIAAFRPSPRRPASFRSRVPRSAGRARDRAASFCPVNDPVAAEDRQLRAWTPPSMR